MAEKLITPTGTLSFQNLFVPQPKGGVADAPLVFGGTLIFKKEAQKSDAYKKLVDECKSLADKLAKEKKIPLGKIALPIKDAEAEGKTKYNGFEPGDTFINPTTKYRPGVVGPNKEAIDDADDVWSGQLARFSVSPFAYNVSGNAGVSLSLNAVQIKKLDAERLDGRADASSQFDDEGDDVF